MDPLHWLAERRIEEALAAGAFDRLPGRGRPLVLDDLDGVPPELRAGYLLLKNGGFLPPELEARKEWLQLADLVAACADDGRRAVLRREEQRALLRYRLLREHAGGGGSAWNEYREELLARIGRGAERAS